MSRAIVPSGEIVVQREGWPQVASPYFPSVPEEVRPLCGLRFSGKSKTNNSLGFYFSKFFILSNRVFKLNKMKELGKKQLQQGIQQEVTFREHLRRKMRQRIK